MNFERLGSAGFRVWTCWIEEEGWRFMKYVGPLGVLSKGRRSIDHVAD